MSARVDVEGSEGAGSAGAAALTARQEAAAGWEGRLELALEERRGRTVIARQSHLGPLRIQRPFYPESEGTCHVYVLHPPGGVVGGDHLRLEISGAGAGSGLITTPGASKFYRSAGDVAEVQQHFQLEDTFCLEWFPQETIAFDGSRARVRTHARLAAGASYAAWDVVCLGRPACNEKFTRGELRLEHRIDRAGTLQWIERAVYRAQDPVLEAHWGLAGHAVVATFVVAPGVAPTEAWVESVRTALESDERDAHVAVTLISSVLLVRYIGAHAHEAMSLFRRAWQCLRPLYAGRPAVEPRIWNT